MKKSAICMIVLFMVFLSAGAANGAKAIAYMQVSATILPWLRYQVIEEQAVLEVASFEEDGYKDGDHYRVNADKNLRHETHEKEYENKPANEPANAKERRAIEIQNGTVLSVDTNTTDGYIIYIQSFDSDVFTAVRIKVDNNGPHVTLTPGNSTEIHIPYNGKGHDRKTLSYDFSLSPGAEAGSYPWPIMVSVHAL